MLIFLFLTVSMITARNDSAMKIVTAVIVGNSGVTGVALVVDNELVDDVGVGVVDDELVGVAVGEDAEFVEPVA